MPKASSKKSDVDDPVGTSGDPVDRYLLVGVAASTQGISAIAEFLDAMPESPGLSIVVLVHDADERSATAVVSELADTCRMSLTAATDGAPIELNHVYVGHGGVQLTVRAPGVLSIGPRSSGSPLDRFFRTVAEQGSRGAVAVLLADVGSEVSIGTAAIRARAPFSFLSC